MERCRDGVPVSSGGSRSAKNGLGKLYERLTAEERFRLDVEAVARGDEADSRRLVDTCPRREYRQNEIAFTGRWRTAIQLTLAVSLDLSPHLARLALLEALKETAPYARTVFVNEAHRAYLEGHEAGSRYAWSRAGMAGDTPGCKFEELEDGSLEIDEDEADPQIEEGLDAIEHRLGELDIAPTLLERLQRDLVEKALPIWEAYRRFCLEELGIESRKLVVAAFEPLLEGVDRLEALASELKVEAEEEQVEECRRLLSEG
jgi:hypothetical protein